MPAKKIDLPLVGLNERSAYGFDSSPASSGSEVSSSAVTYVRLAEETLRSIWLEFDEVDGHVAGPARFFFGLERK